MRTNSTVNGPRKSAPPAVTLTLDMDMPPAPVKPVRRASVPREGVVKAVPVPEASAKQAVPMPKASVDKAVPVAKVSAIKPALEVQASTVKPASALKASVAKHASVLKADAKQAVPAPKLSVDKAVSVAKQRPPRPNSGELEGKKLLPDASASARNKRSFSPPAPQNWPCSQSLNSGQQGGGASAPAPKVSAAKAAPAPKSSVKQNKPAPKAAAKTVAPKAKEAVKRRAKPPVTKGDVVRLEAALALQGGRLWRMSGRHAVAYVGRAEVACALLAVDTRHLAGAAMAVYYDKKGRAVGWQVRFDAGRWEDIARLLG